MEEKDKRQRSKEEKLIFLKAAEEHGITEACQRFGIPHTTYYYWKKKMEEQRLFHLEFGPNKEVIASERALAPPRGYPRVYATNAPQERLGVPEALEIYRDEWTRSRITSDDSKAPFCPWFPFTFEMRPV